MEFYIFNWGYDRGERAGKVRSHCDKNKGFSRFLLAWLPSPNDAIPCISAVQFYVGPTQEPDHHFAGLISTQGNTKFSAP